MRRVAKTDEPTWEVGTPFGAVVREAKAARKVGYRPLSELARDPVTGYQPAHTLLWKIANDEPVKLTPALVRAVAAAAERPVREVQIAAAAQYVGLTAGDPFGEQDGEATRSVAHAPGLSADDMPLVRELLRKLEGGSAG
ncbi:hypothetical protein [Streptomyces virginiae]|uniref:hypothetical protein n=1 Tax=Streptomyces virginiae TaxID=1961 RepID=UPI003326EDEF